MTARIDDRLLETPMSAVQCRACAAQVLVRKSSWQQTSVQWDASGLGQCVERQSAGSLPTQANGLFLACAELGRSIEDAALRGEVQVLEG